MLGDTICAVASPPGPGARGILRISGPDALSAAGRVLDTPLPRDRAVVEARTAVLGHAVPALVLVMPGPRSFTGEDVVELHLPGSPLLLARIQERLERAAADAGEDVRPASPGEFTRRAHAHGRLDLTAAEAVLDLILARTEEERARALDAVSGGLADAVARVRGRVQDVLALLEAGLDFDEGETGAVPRSAWSAGLEALGPELGALQAAVPAAVPGGAVALLGAANAGKSALCNALAGREVVIEAPVAGTTRDVLRVGIGGGVTLLDAPGDVGTGDATDRAALALRDRLLAEAAAALVVVDGRDPVWPEPLRPVLAVVATRGVAVTPPAALGAGVGVFAVDNATGAGIAPLRAFLGRRAGGGASGRGSRLGAELGRARAALERARDAAGAGQPEETVAVDLGEVLAALDAVAGRSSPEDLLDRIFGRFCLGK